MYIAVYLAVPVCKILVMKEKLTWKQFFRTALPLFGFMLVIYLAYSLLLPGSLLHQQQERADTIGRGLDSISVSLDQSLQQLDSALVRLEAARDELRQLPGGPGPADSVMLKEMEITLESMRMMRQRISHRRDSLMARREVVPKVDDNL